MQKMYVAKPVDPTKFAPGEWLLASVELSAAPAELKAFIRVLYLGVLSLSKDGKVSQQLKDQGKGWAAGAKAFLKSLSVGPELVDELYKAQNNKADQDKVTELAKEFRKVMRESIVNDKEVSRTAKDIMKAAVSYFINYSDRLLNVLRKKSPALNEPIISQEMVQQVGAQSTFIKALNKIVKVVTKKSGSILTEEEALNLKKKNKQVYKEYRRLRSSYNSVWKEQLRNYIFKKKVKTIDYKEATDMLNGLGIKFTPLEGFEGRIDANGQLYSKGDKPIKGFPSPELYKVVMNPKYSDESEDENIMVAWKKSFLAGQSYTGKRRAHFFTKGYRKSANKEKVEKVKQLTDWLDKGGRKKWLPFIINKGKKEPNDPRVVASTILELIFQFSARVGSAGKPGLTNILVKDLHPTNNGAMIRYKGKDGIVQIHQIQPQTPIAKTLLYILKNCAKDKKPTDKLFTYKFGDRTGWMTAVYVNRWFQDKLGAPTTVHKLRHYRANKIFEDLLQKNAAKIFNKKKPLTQKDADRYLKLLAENVGKVLGHVRGVGKQQKTTGATALAAYISSELVVEYYNKLGLQTPHQYTGEEEEA